MQENSRARRYSLFNSFLQPRDLATLCEILVNPLEDIYTSNNLEELSKTQVTNPELSINGRRYIIRNDRVKSLLFRIYNRVHKLPEVLHDAANNLAENRPLISEQDTKKYMKVVDTSYKRLVQLGYLKKI